jgi:hypothetical protein
MDNKASKELVKFMIVIEKSIYSPQDNMTMNIDSVEYKATLKEAKAVAKTELDNGHKVEIWKLIGRY